MLPEGSAAATTLLGAPLADRPGSAVAVARQEPAVRHEPAARGRVAYRTAKRALDALAASIGLGLVLPLCLWIALRIKLQDGGPVLFRQTRVGASGRTFTFYKFRSMTLDADARLEPLLIEAGSPVRFKLETDPRVTPYGIWLRQTSLDELPQLWNVLRGDMSLVGPRPPLPAEVARYDERQRRRLAVPGGLTCFWQVSGRSLLGFDAQVELDLDYVARRGLLVDLGILLRTPGAVLSRRGAW